MKSALDRLVREARQDLGRSETERLDWDGVRLRLFARIEEERARAEPSRRPASGRRAVFGYAAAAAGLAAAAAVALVAGKGDGRRPLDAARPSANEVAGNLVAVEGAGQVSIHGSPALRGAALHAGDAIEANGARATVQRTGKVTFLVEDGARATVERGQGALVLALERGGVEARVVPVANGEAFAVDVGTARVAVHGTHLRVARAGEHVVVDLSEGVVSVGAAPRVGSTLGTLVTAPAHVEFAAGDPAGTLTVTHDASAVRPPVDLDSFASAKTDPSVVLPAVRPPGAEPHAGAPAPSSRLEPRAGAAAPSPPPSSAPANAEGDLGAAVRACMAERPSAENVTVSVKTTLTVTLHDDGTVQSARFDPPVAPDVNACAAQSIYKTRFAHGGAAAIAIDFKAPSSAP